MLVNKRFVPAMFVACCLATTPNIAARIFAFAQTTQQPDDIVFEVASIRVNTTPSDLTRSRITAGGGYTATRISLVDLMLRAYGIQRFQLMGGPPWMRRERFDIVARATGELTTSGARPTLPGAIRALLKARFKVVEHTESRELQVYVLKMARKERLGPNLVPSDTDCAAIPIRERKPGQCTVSAPGMPGRYFAMSSRLSSMVAALQIHVDRPIIDETGLKGSFKIELNWTPERLPTTLAGVAQLPGGGSIFTAIQEQLGLKLEATTAPIPVVVIDAVEYPTND